MIQNQVTRKFVLLLSLIGALTYLGISPRAGAQESCQDTCAAQNEACIKGCGRNGACSQECDAALICCIDSCDHICSETCTQTNCD